MKNLLNNSNWRDFVERESNFARSLELEDKINRLVDEYKQYIEDRLLTKQLQWKRISTYEVYTEVSKMTLEYRERLMRSL